MPCFWGDGRSEYGTDMSSEEGSRFAQEIELEGDQHGSQTSALYCTRNTSKKHKTQQGRECKRRNDRGDARNLGRRQKLSPRRQRDLANERIVVAVKSADADGSSHALRR